MISKIKTVSLYSIVHALIDFTCIYTIVSGIIANSVNWNESLFLVVLYNVLAFGLQVVIGDFFDKTNKPHICAVIGCILTAISAVIFKFNLTAAIIAGLGNAFFHIGGGIICLKSANHKASIAGIYVAPGALGLFLGALTAKNSIIMHNLTAIILIIAALCMFFNRYKENHNIEETSFGHKEIPKFLLILNFMLWAIVIRSFIGFSIVTPWKSSIIFSVFLTLAVVFGKIFGGIIADKFGWIKTTVIALIISSPLIAFGINIPAIFITGIFFFNFTMPVTLSAIANILPNREGYAFGLTALALIIGAFPVFYGVKTSSNNAVLLFIIILISAILLYFGLKYYFENNNN